MLLSSLEIVQAHHRLWFCKDLPITCLSGTGHAGVGDGLIRHMQLCLLAVLVAVTARCLDSLAMSFPAAQHRQHGHHTGGKDALVYWQRFGSGLSGEAGAA